jgi:hypothetical protein
MLIALFSGGHRIVATELESNSLISTDKSLIIRYAQN